MSAIARVAPDAANPRALEHDPEKLTDFSDKIMRPDKEKHDPETLADFSDKVMRPDRENEGAIESP